MGWDVSNRTNDFWDWNRFSSELKDAISNIIHSSTLKTLSLDGIINVPITIFQHIVHITTLELLSITAIDFNDENSKKVAPTCMGSHAVIDQCVWHFGQEQVRYEIPTESIFLPFMSRLRFLEVCIGLNSTMHDYNFLSFFMESLCISLTSPATLEHLKFTFQSRGPIAYYEWPYTFYENSRDAGVWVHVDSITTHPTGSRLQRVDININFHVGNESDKYIIEKAFLEELPLLRLKGILFVKAVYGEWLW